MRRVTIVAAAAILAASVVILASCQSYEAEPVTPVALGAVTEPHLIQGKRTPPYVMLVVDRSGSMNDAISGGTTKLLDVKDKFASGNGFLAKTGSGAEFGLVLYSSDDDCQSGAIIQPVGASIAQVQQSINNATAKGGTPTAGSLKAVLDDPKMSTPQAGRDRYVMLLTDGAPNCNSQLDPNTCTPTDGCGTKTWKCCLDDNATVQQVADLASQGIRTFVIGFGNATSNPSSDAYKVLDRAAEAGGLAKTQEPKFYQANSSADLQKALDAFGNVILSCKYTLSETPRELVLSGDVKRLALDVAFVYTNDGNREEVLAAPGTASQEWTYDAGSRQVSIIGNRCAEIERGPSGLKIEFRYLTSL